MKKMLFFGVALALISNLVNAQSTSSNNTLGSTGVTSIQSTTSSSYKLSVGGAVKQFGTGLTSSTSPTLFLQNSTSTTGRHWGINSSDGGLFQVFDVSASNAIRLTINSNGNLGIGTTNPQTLLSLGGTNGDMLFDTRKFTYNGNYYNWVCLNGSTNNSDYNFLTSFSDKNLYINRPAGKGIYFEEGDNFQMAMAPGGNFSIGSGDVANAKLEVNTTTSNDGFYLRNGTNGFVRIFPSTLTGASFNPLTQTGDAGLFFGKTLQGSGSNSTFGFVLAPWHNSAAGLRMDVNGNIGINLATPTAPLDVNGNIKATGLILTSGAGVNKILGSDASGNATWQSPSSLFSGWSLGGNSSINPASQFIGTTDMQPVLFKANNTEAMRINTSGNIGIGTSTPASRLTVDGDIENTSIKLTVNGNNNSYIHGKVNGLSLDGSTGFLYLTGSASATDGSIIGSRSLRICTTNDGQDGLLLQPTSINTRPRDGTRTLSIGANNISTAYFDQNGRMGIGTTNTSDANFKLFVEGSIRARKVKVDQDTWSDYVFENDYRLRSLAEVREYIKQHRHLPDVPSAKEVTENGIDIGDNQSILLRKIEELTLYAIEQDKKLEDQNKQLNSMQQQIEELKKSIKKN